MIDHYVTFIYLLGSLRKQNYKIYKYDSSSSACRTVHQEMAYWRNLNDDDDGDGDTPKRL